MGKWLAFGHTIPLLDLAKVIAQKGLCWSPRSDFGKYSGKCISIRTVFICGATYSLIKESNVTKYNWMV